MKYIGAHVSAAGGVENAPLNAVAIGAKAFALFTKNQKRWVSPPLTEGSILEFRANIEKAGISADMILPHDSYLINLGNPEVTAISETPAKWKVFNAICVEGSPNDCAVTIPIASPGAIS